MKSYTVFNQAPHLEDILGSGGIARRILKLDTRWKLVVVSFMIRPLYSGERTHLPTEEEAG